jgi:hypothetical protein
MIVSPHDSDLHILGAQDCLSKMDNPPKARRWALVLFVFLMASLQAGCLVRERRGTACRGGVFVEGHYGPRGRWHPGHWRCPGQPVIVEVD